MQLSLQKRDEEVATKAAEIERLKAMTTLSRGDLSRVLSEDHGGGGNGGAPDKAALRNAFNMIDADGGGTLDRDEVGQLSEKLGRKLTDKELDEMRAKMDSDGSGDPTAHADGGGAPAAMRLGRTRAAAPQQFEFSLRNVKLLLHSLW